MISRLTHIPDKMSVDSDEYVRIRDSLGSSEKVILYAIGSEGLPIGSTVNLQKVIFLSAESVPSILGDAFFFEAHKKGPYCKDIDETVIDLSNSGLISGDSLNLTPKGDGVYRLIESFIKEPLKSTIDYWKEFEDGITEDELLTYVYYTFPDMVRNSEVIERVNKDKVKNILSLVKKGKISAEKGSEILDMDYYEFEDFLRENKIRWKG